MFPSLFDSTTIPVLSQVVNFAEARHEILASNLANYDVPGYKTRDLSPELFQQNLRQAIDRSNMQFSWRSPGEAVSEGYDAFRDVKESFKSILYHDKSDVSMEQQIAEATKNQMMHNMALTIMTNQFRLLQSAISERAV